MNSNAVTINGARLMFLLTFPLRPDTRSHAIGEPGPLIKVYEWKSEACSADSEVTSLLSLECTVTAWNRCR